MNYEVKEQLYEGKAKQVFSTNDPEIVMVHYKDDATADDGREEGHHPRQGHRQQQAVQRSDAEAGKRGHPHPLCRGSQ